MISQPLHVVRYVIGYVKNVLDRVRFKEKSRRSKSIVEKFREILTGDRPERNVSPKAIKRPGTIHDHISEHSGLRAGKHIFDTGMPLNSRANLPLDRTPADFDDALKFVDD